MQKSNSMQKLTLVIAIVLGFSSCTVQKGKQNLRWIESQVLCVYWSPDFEKRDTLSAINFTIEANSEDILKTAEYSFNVGDRKYALKKATLVDKGQYFLQGLKLECQALFEEFKDDIYIEGGPCYEESLATMVNEGKLFLKVTSNQEIPKSDTFSLYKGLKEK
jgi:hypothetical protein